MRRTNPLSPTMSARWPRSRNAQKKTATLDAPVQHDIDFEVQGYDPQTTVEDPFEQDLAFLLNEEKGSGRENIVEEFIQTPSRHAVQKREDDTCLPKAKNNISKKVKKEILDFDVDFDLSDDENAICDDCQVKWDMIGSLKDRLDDLRINDTSKGFAGQRNGSRGLSDFDQPREEARGDVSTEDVGESIKNNLAFSRTLMVHGLSEKVNEDILKSSFKDALGFKESRLVYDKNGKPKNFAFVEFTSPEHAQMALEMSKGKQLLGKRLHLSIACSSSKSAKNHNKASELKPTSNNDVDCSDDQSPKKTNKKSIHSQELVPKVFLIIYHLDNSPNIKKTLKRKFKKITGYVSCTCGYDENGEYKGLVGFASVAAAREAKSIFNNKMGSSAEIRELSNSGPEFSLAKTLQETKQRQKNVDKRNVFDQQKEDNQSKKDLSQNTTRRKPLAQDAPLKESRQEKKKDTRLAVVVAHNLPPAITLEEFRDLFSNSDGFVTSELVVDSRDHRKTYGHIIMTSRSTAITLIGSLKHHNGECLNLQILSDTAAKRILKTINLAPSAANGSKHDQTSQQIAKADKSNIRVEAGSSASSLPPTNAAYKDQRTNILTVYNIPDRLPKKVLLSAFEDYDGVVAAKSTTPKGSGVGHVYFSSEDHLKKAQERVKTEDLHVGTQRVFLSEPMKPNSKADIEKASNESNSTTNEPKLRTDKAKRESRRGTKSKVKKDPKTEPEPILQASSQNSKDTEMNKSDEKLKQLKESINKRLEEIKLEG